MTGGEMFPSRLVAELASKATPHGCSITTVATFLAKDIRCDSRHAADGVKMLLLAPKLLFLGAPIK